MIVRLLVVLCVLFLHSSVFAQYTRDKAAQNYMDKAINEHYLATDFDKAEQILSDTIKACGDKCSPQMLGKLWMYVGIVRGSGKGNLPGAEEAFQAALAADPNVKLDEALATDETKESFKAAGGTKVAPTPPTPPAETEPAEVGGGLECTPAISEVQTRRAIPVSCKADAPITSGEIRYIESGGTQWKTVKMVKRGEFIQAEIPCKDTGIPGSLKMYVSALDGSGAIVDSYGNRKSPVLFQLGDAVSAHPPAYPGQQAPARCGETEVCPPDFPGCATQVQCGDLDWGATCTSSADCKCGLLCENGVCETAPSCTSDAECPAGVCIASVGKCGVPRGAETAAAPYKKHWLGVHVAQDIAFLGGADVCVNSVQDSENFSCFFKGSSEPYFNPGTDPDPELGEPFPGKGIANGAALATTRILASYEFAFKPNVTAGLRLGFAFGGGPDQPALGQSFLPVHVEARGTYWIRPLSVLGFRPYVHLGGGLAQVDTKVEISVLECGWFNRPENADQNGFGPCVQGQTPQKTTLEDEANLAGGDAERLRLVNPTVDVWKRTGQFFLTGGGGLVLAVKPNLGIQLNLNAMFLVPSVGFALEPSLGAVLGF